MESNPQKHADNVLGPRTMGLLMIGIGTLMLLLASVMHTRQLKKLRKCYPEAQFSQSIILAALISILGVLMFIAVIAGR